MNDFTGQLCLEGHELEMLSHDNMLLRGCQLRTTEWVLGLVLSTGPDTKINFKPPAKAGEQEEVKRGHTDALINRDIIGTVILLVICSIFGATQVAAGTSKYQLGGA